MDPFKILLEATKRVPVMKYALAVAGILSVISIAITFRINLMVGVFSSVAVLVLMVLMILMAKLSSINDNEFIRKPALVFLWFCLLLFIIISVFSASSLFIKQPLDLSSMITNLAGNTFTQHIEFRDPNLKEWKESNGSVSIFYPDRPKEKVDLRNDGTMEIVLLNEYRNQKLAAELECEGWNFNNTNSKRDSIVFTGKKMVLQMRREIKYDTFRIKLWEFSRTKTGKLSKLTDTVFIKYSNGFGYSNTWTATGGSITFLMPDTCFNPNIEFVISSKMHQPKEQTLSTAGSDDVNLEKFE
jgi:hypothetical protein